jgi:hypothetical protein
LLTVKALLECRPTGLVVFGARPTPRHARRNEQRKNDSSQPRLVRCNSLELARARRELGVLVHVLIREIHVQIHVRKRACVHLDRVSVG